MVGRIMFPGQGSCNVALARAAPGAAHGRGRREPAAGYVCALAPAAYLLYTRRCSPIAAPRTPCAASRASRRCRAHGARFSVEERMYRARTSSSVAHAASTHARAESGAATERSRLAAGARVDRTNLAAKRPDRHHSRHVSLAVTPARTDLSRDSYRRLPAPFGRGLKHRRAGSGSHRKPPAG